jgi:thiol:disulfide interchange protein DsbD
MLMLSAAALFAAVNSDTTRPATPVDPAPGQESRWSHQTLSNLLARGEAVLVNITADWCLTCLANETVALETAEVQDALRKQGIYYLKGDWTQQDTEITRYLESFGRNGVPLYVLYRVGDPQQYRLLPQILTPGQVVEAITWAATSPGDKR